MDFKNDFLTKQIIAYIGNKRSLLPLIYEAITSIYPEIPPGLKFLDAFAGSGVVARLAKVLHFEVHANDWEEYAFLLNTAYLKIDQSRLPELFAAHGGLETLLAGLNSLPDPPVAKQYLARYYAPAKLDVKKANYRRERLFYTRSNALILDKIRNKIEELYPPESPQFPVALPRALLIALLLYQAATHTNTSGVFKACHKGFGGHTGDALSRILAPVLLSLPVLIDSPYPAFVYAQDANRLVQEPGLQGLDIAYLDPPYNQHQYGSNYHLLNTIALWDKIPAPLDLTAAGVLKEKAAIRKDWIQTRSAYCYRDSACASFTSLIADLDARYILVSYSTDGIIPFGQMLDICSRKGRVSLVTNAYTKYKGGKQSNLRLNRNIEFIITIDTTRRSTVRSTTEIHRILKQRELTLLWQKHYCARRLALQFTLDAAGGCLLAELPSVKLELPMKWFYTLEGSPPLERLTAEDRTCLVEKLEAACCQSNEEELAEIVLHLEQGSEPAAFFLRLIPGILRKLAHKKNKELFYQWLTRVKKLPQQFPGAYPSLAAKILEIEEVAEKRFLN